MKQKAEDDRARRTVQVAGATIDDALEQAAIELSVPLKRIEYEVIEPPSAGFLGYGKKNCILIAYEIEKKKKDKFSEGDFDLGFDTDDMEADIRRDRDGEVIVKFRQEGVFMKVYPPVGEGQKVTEKEALSIIKNKGITGFNKSIVSALVKSADGERVRIADYEYNPMNDALMTVQIKDAEMKASVYIEPPGEGGSDITSESIIGLLKANGVIHGILEEYITEIEDHPVYNQHLVVAEGSKPVNGNDSKIVYNFEEGQAQVNYKEKHGKVDFKEMNKIQNVVEGQILARKTPAEEGIPGRTVLGKLLPAKSGTNYNFSIGKNVRISTDGTTAIADLSGQVMITAGKLTVEPVYVVPGDVNLKSGGNIIFLGSVVVNGSVEDGFKVKASGNIEVLGNVGKAEIDADGNVIVHQGINGKTEGLVRAGKTIWSKFIENVNVECGDAVVATDGIINSNVISDRLIACMGKRATIVGGRLRATEEIHAKTLGSPTGSETILEVGWDPKSKEKLQNLEKELEEKTTEIDDIERNILTLQNYKRKKKKLPEDKEEYLAELEEKKEEEYSEKARLEEDIEKIKEYLYSLKYVGKVSAAKKVYPGVKILVKDANLKVRNEFNSSTFVNEDGDVKVLKYIPLEEDLSR
ncbi:MAG: FapA family protein [Spirochaetales bacterium]|nr:FapA family protein [Spirochaetales bacterium]